MELLPAPGVKQRFQSKQKRLLSFAGEFVDPAIRRTVLFRCIGNFCNVEVIILQVLCASCQVMAWLRLPKLP
ncbi:MAG: hypothetical protein ACREVH_02630 [Gammaproteobacteria bacterium]